MLNTYIHTYMRTKSSKGVNILIILLHQRLCFSHAFQSIFRTWSNHYRLLCPSTCMLLRLSRWTPCPPSELFFFSSHTYLRGGKICWKCCWKSPLLLIPEKIKSNFPFSEQQRSDSETEMILRHWFKEQYRKMELILISERSFPVFSCSTCFVCLRFE